MLLLKDKKKNIFEIILIILMITISILTGTRSVLIYIALAFIYKYGLSIKSVTSGNSMCLSKAYRKPPPEYQADLIIFCVKALLVVALDSYRGYLLAEVYKLINNRLTKAYAEMNYEYYIEQNTGFLNNLMTVEVNQVEAAFNRFCQMLSELMTASVFLCISFSINLAYCL